MNTITARQREHWFAVVLVLGSLFGEAKAQETAGRKGTPCIEDYATVESVCAGVPVYSFGNLVYVYGQSPDFYPGAIIQEGNAKPVVKIKPKKSWEIKRSPSGESTTASSDCTGYSVPALPSL